MRHHPDIEPPDPEEDAPAVVDPRVQVEIGREHDPRDEVRRDEYRTGGQRRPWLRPAAGLHDVGDRRKRGTADNRDDIVGMSAGHSAISSYQPIPAPA